MVGMRGKQLRKPASSIAAAIAVMVVFAVFLVAMAILEEVTLGTHYVSSLYRTPIDWLVERVSGPLS
jgi:hypothetical protein